VITTTQAPRSDLKSKDTSAVAEHFLLYDFFRAPGLRYDREEDPKANTEHQQQLTSLASIHVVENERNPEEPINQIDRDQVSSIQCLVINVNQNLTENQDPTNGEQWAGFPYMNTEHYGYRLCSSLELKVLKEEFEKSKQRCACCSQCCC
jgi:hypothetical protein